MDVDGWEEQIDVDDSDLPSLLHLSNPNTKSLKATEPPSSLLHLSNPQTREPPPSLLPCSHPPPPNPNPTPQAFRPIPGPAGVLQEKRHLKKKNLGKQTTTSPPLLSTASSQVESQMMDGCELVDADFQTSPWLHALRSSGGFSVRCSIGAIKKNRGGARRVEEVLGMVSSCRSNGLGGLVLMLKDPTGTIGAFVHHKVLTDTRFSNVDIEVGCVLILKQVAVFPIRSVVYLNVTRNNVAEIVEKHCGPPHKSMMSTFRERGSGKHSEAGARADNRIPRTLGVDHSESPRVDEIHKTISTNNIAPHREATKQFSTAKTIKNGNLEGNPDDVIIPGLTGNWAPKDLQNPTSQTLPLTMRVPPEVSEAEHTLDKSRKPPYAGSSKVGSTLGDRLPTSAFSIHAMPNKEVPNKSRVSAGSICASRSRVSDGALDKFASNTHATRSEQNLDKSKATTNLGRENIDRLPGYDCNTLASNLHHKNAFPLGHLSTTRQEPAKASTSSGASQARDQLLVNGAGHFPANLKDSSSALKENAPPVIGASEPKRLVAKALGTDWTDEQLAELFSDCQDDDDLFKLRF